MTEPIRYEDNAVEVTVTGWACKTCGRFHGTHEHAAKYCCATDFPCKTKGCDGRMSRCWMYCQSCRDKIYDEKYNAREAVEWDGQAYLVSDTTNEYFFDADALAERIEERECDDDREYMQTVEEYVESLRLLICVPCSVREFRLDEWLDIQTEDGEWEPPGDWKKVQNLVNDYIKEHSPLEWQAGPLRPTLESVLAVVKGR